MIFVRFGIVAPLIHTVLFITKTYAGLRSLLLCGFTILASTPAFAQITPDNTLGAESSRLTTNIPIAGENGDRIDGGATRGSNLFHSFSDFNINEGQRVYFVNPNGIQNILTRVTGGKASNILGTLGVDGGANLFLLNPNGIIFGQNASLDLRGSFVGTTANAIGFGEQGFFSATNPQAPPILTVNPSALLYTQLNGGGITNRAQPQYAEQGSRYFVGGNVTFDGGVAVVAGNRLELGGLAGSGTIGLSGSGNQLQLNFPQGVLLADVVLQNRSGAFANNGGAITISAGNLNLSGNSYISTTLDPGEGSPSSPAGDVVINATGAVTIDGNSSINSTGYENSLGDSGNVTIDAQAIRLDNTGEIYTTSEKNRGSIRLSATSDVTLDGNSGINTFGNPNSIGNSGDITINARNINLSNSSTISSGNRDQGRGGRTTLQATDAIALASGSKIESSIIPSESSVINSSASGNIEIVARSLTLDGQNTKINSDNLSEGRAGDIRITTDDEISLNESDITAATSGQGDGGNIGLTTRSLTLSNGSQIGAQATGSGNSGSLLVNASDSVTLSGTGVFLNPLDGKNTITGSSLSTGAIGSGNSGQITINTGRLSIGDGGYILTGTNSGSGQGGNITINAPEAVEVVGTDPTGISSAISSSNLGNGDAGDVTINTSRLSIRDGALVSMTAFKGSTGQAGDLTINAPEAVEVVGTDPTGVPSRIDSSTFGTGDAGDMTINTGRLSIRDGSFVQTAASEGSTGQGGDLTINASDSVEIVGASPVDEFNSQLITFSAGSGNAGRISIDTRRLSLDNGAYITASTVGSGRGGDININATDSIEISANPADTDGADGIFTSTVGSGDAGNLSLRTQRLSVRNGGAVSARTGSTGKGGSVTINASDSVEVFGISNDGRLPSLLTVRSQGEGAAGNITVNSPRISVKDRGAVIAESNAVDGGDINLKNVNILSLRRGGNISATAGANENPGNGGNITIDADFIITVPNENSDITANAFSGRGGNVKISTQGIFGIQKRAKESFPTNDITASSTQNVQGQINITEPNVQPTQGLVELPTQVLDASDQIAQTCPSGANANRPLGEFVVTGRGGSLPPNPIEPLAGSTSLSPLASLDSETQTNILSPSAEPVSTATPTTIVEAQGWVKTPDGKIALVASAPSTTPVATTTQATCPVSR